MQNIQTILHTAIQSLFPTSISTSPLLLVSSSQKQFGDESARLELIYEENEHFYNQYNLANSTDSDSNDAYDYYDNLNNKIANLLFETINNNFHQPETFGYAPFKQIETHNGLIYLYTNNNQDSLFIQISDDHIYITFTQSGQY